LNSDRGRKFQQETTEKAKHYGSQIRENGQQQIEQLSSNVNRWIEQGQAYANDLQTVLKETINSEGSKTDDSESSFQKGVRKAKAAVKAQRKATNNGTV
ncbi:MAG: hypothetical protein AAFP82_13030, partial [Bacteroidota bacterium]